MDDKLYLEKLNKFMCAVKEIAVCRVKLEHLEKQGLPEGSVVYSNTTKRYVDKNGTEHVYNYTTSYIYMNSKKYVVSKKYTYAAQLGGFVDENFANDPRNQIAHPFLQKRLELRKEIKEYLKAYTEIARMYCNSLNGMPRLKNASRYNLHEAIENACNELAESDEYCAILNELDSFLDIQHGPVCENNREAKKYLFTNRIRNEKGEQFRSKNEAIAVDCINECGISYSLEPFYPESDYRADFAIIRCKTIYEPCNCLPEGAINNIKKAQYDKKVVYEQIFVEIVGLRRNEKYEKKLREKQAMAKKYGIPLLIIDMTDYPDKYGNIQTRLDYAKLCEIFQKVHAGLIRAEGQIMTPY